MRKLLIFNENTDIGQMTFEEILNHLQTNHNIKLQEYNEAIEHNSEYDEDELDCHICNQYDLIEFVKYQRDNYIFNAGCKPNYEEYLGINITPNEWDEFILFSDRHETEETITKRMVNLWSRWVLERQKRLNIDIQKHLSA
jgi:hypothetical protein